MQYFSIPRFIGFLSIFSHAIAEYNPADPSNWMDDNPDPYIPPTSVSPSFTTTSEAITETVENRPVITTIALPYSITTATTDAGSVSAGDLIVTFTDDFSKHLVDAAKSACGGPGSTKLKARDAASCQNLGQFMNDMVGDGAPGGLDIIAFNRPVITANDMEAAIRTFFATGRVLFKSRIFIGGICALWLGLYLKGQNVDAKAPINIPSGDLGNPTGTVAPDLPGTTVVGTVTSTSPTCKATKTGKTQPVCEDNENCSGLAQKTCEVQNDDHLCPCRTLEAVNAHTIDVNLIDAQQLILPLFTTYAKIPGSSPTQTSTPTTHSGWGSVKTTQCASSTIGGQQNPTAGVDRDGAVTAISSRLSALATASAPLIKGGDLTPKSYCIGEKGQYTDDGDRVLGIYVNWVPGGDGNTACSDSNKPWDLTDQTTMDLTNQYLASTFDTCAPLEQQPPDKKFWKVGGGQIWVDCFIYTTWVVTTDRCDYSDAGHDGA